jgi:hypothetical protein
VRSSAIRWFNLLENFGWKIKILSMRNGSPIRSSQQMVLGLMVRLGVYALLLGAIAFGMLWGAVVYDSAFYDEVGPVETLETVFALSAALIFLFAAKTDRNRAPCSVLVGGFLFCVAVRESDYFLDVLVCRHAWKVIVSLILVLFSFYCMRNFRRVEESVIRFMSEASFGIFISGLLVLIVFSRLFGYGDFWEAIMDDSSYRTVKTIVEEGVEMMGYFLIFVSSIEYFHDSKIDQKYPDLPLGD